MGVIIVIEFNKHIKNSRQYKTIIKLFKSIKEMKGKDKLIYLGVITAYLLNPFDIIPDFSPIIGLIDDLLVIIWATEYIRNNVPINQFKKDIKSKIIVDTIGVGVGVVSRLKEVIRTENLKTRVIPAHFGEQAIKKDKYLNKKAENYFRLKSLMEDDLIKILDLKKLRRDLSLMKFELSSNGKIKVIDPEKSPDYSDALVFFVWKGNKGLSFDFV